MEVNEQIKKALETEDMKTVVTLLNKIEHEFWLKNISDQEKVMFALNVIQKLWIDFEGTLTLNDVVIKSIVFRDTEVEGVNEDE